MRYRIGNINTGLGNPSPCLLPNTWSKNEKLNKIARQMLQEALDLQPIKDYGGLDFKVEVENGSFNIMFGYEPAYQHDGLFIYHIRNSKNKCGIKMGIAKGCYGSNIKITQNTNYNSSDEEFKQLVDRWHDELLKSI